MPRSWLDADTSSALSLHQYTKQEPWGVEHVGGDQVEEMLAYTVSLRRLQARGRPMPQLIVVDDLSELLSFVSQLCPTHAYIEAVIS